MAAGSVKMLKRLDVRRQFKSIQQEIGKQMQTVGRAHVQARAAIVSDFDTDIKFGYEVKISEAQVTLAVNVTNASQQLADSDWTVGELWRSLDRTGTKPHDIYPKEPGGVLRFQWGYVPHTRPGGFSGGPGAAQGDVAFSKFVHHPGYAPRHFSDKINKRLRRQFQQAVDRGVRIGGRKR